MQFITTKFLGPTNTRPSRYKASASGGRTFTVSADHEGHYDDNHDRAALALIRILDWPTDGWTRGEGQSGNVYVRNGQWKGFDNG